MEWRMWDRIELAILLGMYSAAPIHVRSLDLDRGPVMQCQHNRPFDRSHPRGSHAPSIQSSICMNRLSTDRGVTLGI